MLQASLVLVLLLDVFLEVAEVDVRHLDVQCLVHLLVYHLLRVVRSLAPRPGVVERVDTSLIPVHHNLRRVSRTVDEGLVQLLQTLHLVVLIEAGGGLLDDALELRQPPLLPGCIYLLPWQLEFGQWCDRGAPASLVVALGEERGSGGHAVQVLGWQDLVVVPEAHVDDPDHLGPLVLQLLDVVDRFLFLQALQEALILLVNLLLLELVLHRVGEVLV